MRTVLVFLLACGSSAPSVSKPTVPASSETAAAEDELAPAEDGTATPVTATAPASTKLIKRFRINLRNKVTPQSICTAAQPDDCVMLGLRTLYGDSGFAKDVSKALSYYRIACGAGDTGGCTNLADHYFTGNGVKQDDAEGMRLLRHACTQGDCYSLGVKLAETNDRADRVEALTILASVCDDTDYSEVLRAFACRERGDRTFTGTNGAPWYLKGCELGEERSCEQLASAYLRDGYPGINAAAATRALEEMCDREFAIACDHAAQRHFQGKGAPASRAESVRWFQKACTHGYKFACDVLRKGAR